MNTTAKAAVALACLPYEQFQAEVAEASPSTQPAMGEPDQGPFGHRPPSIINVATPELGDAARIEARSEGFTAGKAVGFTEGHPKGVEEGHAKGLDEGRAAVGVKPGDLNAFESGAAAARRVLGKAVVPPAEMLKFNAGAEAARGLLGKVVGGEAELAAFNSGAAAARALLGKKPEPTSANF
jgi:hypothetical protein